MSEYPKITQAEWESVLDRLAAIERVTLPLTPLGPRKESAEDTVARGKAMADAVRYLKSKFDAEKNAPPVDRSNQILASGEPVPEDRSHTVLKPSGQQQDYVVLTESERHKGYVRRYRDAYRHLKCGKITTMSRAIAETYARDPSFYTGTFCSTCLGHFPIGENGEFVWYEMDGQTGPKVGT